MLNFFAVLLLSLVISSYTFAEDCNVSNNLRNKICSDDYYKPKNLKELDDYLLNGKFKNGKLLNLEINFNINEKEINIATACDLKISLLRKLNAKQNGICLKGSSINFEAGNLLFADKNAPIDITASSSVITRKTIIETKGNLNITTTNFLPLDGEILISRDSYLKARNIHLNTKSSLLINHESNLKADQIILDGGNCEVSEKNDIDNNYEKNYERACQRFFPKFNYIGKCKTNTLPTNFKIVRTADSLNPQSIIFSISGAPSSSIINWKFDQEKTSNESISKQYFNHPGKHLTQAAIISTDGSFRKVGQSFNIGLSTLNKGQYIIFQLYGSKNAPSKLIGAIDLLPIILTKLSKDSDLYYTEIIGNKSGIKNLWIPFINYHSKFTLNILPAIANPGQYLNQKIDLIDLEFNNLIDDSIIGNISISLKKISSEIRAKINSLSNSDKIKLASKIQSNLEITSNLTTSSSFTNQINLLDLFVSQVFANTDVELADKRTITRMRTYLASDIISVGVGITLTASGIALVSIAPDPLDRIMGYVIFYNGMKIILNEFKRRNQVITDISNFIGSFIIDHVSGDEIHTIKLIGNFIAVNEINDLSSKSSLLRETIQSNTTFNSSISPINDGISAINNSLGYFGITYKIGDPVPRLAFSQVSYQGTLSPEFITSVKVISSEYNNITLEPFTKKQNNIDLKFKTDQSQNVTIRITYKNDDLGLNVYKDISIYVKSKPASYTSIKIDPKRTFFQMVSNPFNDIYLPSPAISIPTNSHFGLFLELGAFNTSDSCMGMPGCDQKSMVVVFSDGVNYLSPGPSSSNISSNFYQNPSRYYVPPQAFALSSDPSNPSIIEIPLGAKYIYVSPADDYFRDNSDLNGDYYLNMSIYSVSEELP